MKTLGLTIILCSGVLVLLFLLVPLGVEMQINAYPSEKLTVNGQQRVAQITVTNNGWFTQRVSVPELAACVGDQEVLLDSWLATGGTVVPGSGQRGTVTLHAGESGTVYLVARDSTLLEHMHIYKRVPYFSCLSPGEPLPE